MTPSPFPTVLFSAVCLSACMVGPDYQKPDTATPAQWQTPVANTVTAKPVALKHWWQTFNDPILTSLIQQAQTGNRDLFQAEARIREARARRQLAVANLLPTSSINASASQSGSSEAANNINVPGFDLTNDLYSNTLDASWELDIFGKRRRSLESSAASLQASEEDLRDVLVSLCAEVALNYVDVRGYQQRLAITEANLAAQQETFDITYWREQAGLVSGLDLVQAKLTLENTRASLPSLRSSLEQAKHRLAALLGNPPAALQTLLDKSAAIPVATAQIMTGIPADVLRQRPDIRRSERKLAAQTAQIGVAEAARYPSFNLSGSIGVESLLTSNLYTASAKTFQMAASSAWVLFDSGRIRSNVAIQTALQEQALGAYQATVLTALRDVENALTAYTQEQQRRTALQASVQAGISAMALANEQYQSGTVDFQRVLDSQRSLLSAQTQLATSEAEIAANVVRLYKALGGGWQTEQAHG